MIGVALVLQVLLALAAWWPEPRAPVGDEKLYLAAATEPFDGRLVTLPPLWPPLWPHLLRPVLAVGGTPAVVVLQVLLLGSIIAGLGVLARRAMGPAVVMPVVVLALADPLLGAFAHYFWPELVFLALVIATSLLASGQEVGLGRGAAIGALTATATLLKSLFGPIAPLVALLSGWRARSGRRVAVGALTLLAFLAVALPFALEAEREVPGATGASARFNLLVALREDGRQSLALPNVALETFRESTRSAGESWAARLAWIDSELAEELGTTKLVPELADRVARHPFRLLEWRSFLVEQLPGAAFEARERGGYRGTPPWLVLTLTWWSGAHVAVILILVGIGLVAAPWTRRTAAVAVFVFTGWQLAVLLAVHTISRYRLQLEPVLLLLAAGGWVALRRGGLSKRRYAIAAGLAGILLLCAFGGPWVDGWGWGMGTREGGMGP